MLRWTVHGQEPQARADDIEGLGSRAAMLVVLVGLRFGVAPFLWRSEDRAPADVLLLPLLRVRGDAFTFRRKTAGVILPALNVGSFTAAD